MRLVCCLLNWPRCWVGSERRLVQLGLQRMEGPSPLRMALHLRCLQMSACLNKGQKDAHKSVTHCDRVAVQCRSLARSGCHLSSASMFTAACVLSSASMFTAACVLQYSMHREDDEQRNRDAPVAAPEDAAEGAPGPKLRPDCPDADGDAADGWPQCAGVALGVATG